MDWGDFFSMKETIKEERDHINWHQMYQHLGMALFYFMAIVLMAIWRNKLISHVFLLKSTALFLGLLIDAAYASRQLVPWHMSVAITVPYLKSSFYTAELFLTPILFQELYVSICRLEIREYSVLRLLKKVSVATIVAIVWACLFESVINYFPAYSDQFIDKICLNVCLAVPLLYFYIRISITLLQSGHFRKESFIKNSFVINLMTVLLLTHM